MRGRLPVVAAPSLLSHPRGVISHIGSGMALVEVVLDSLVFRLLTFLNPLRSVLALGMGRRIAGI